MKYSFVLALFLAFFTVSEFPAFAQTYEVQCSTIQQQVSQTSVSETNYGNLSNEIRDTPSSRTQSGKFVAVRSYSESHALPSSTPVRSPASLNDGSNRTTNTDPLQSANAENSLAVKNPEQSANLWKWSVATLISANALDIASSYGLKEGNPLLGTRFDGRSLAIKSGLTAGQLVAQYFVLRKHPERRRTAAIVNFAIAGGLGIVSAHNFGIRSGR